MGNLPKKIIARLLLSRDYTEYFIDKRYYSKFLLQVDIFYDDVKIRRVNARIHFFLQEKKRLYFHYPSLVHRLAFLLNRLKKIPRVSGFYLHNFIKNQLIDKWNKTRQTRRVNT